MHNEYMDTLPNLLFSPNFFLLFFPLSKPTRIHWMSTTRHHQVVATVTQQVVATMSQRVPVIVTQRVPATMKHWVSATVKQWVFAMVNQWVATIVNQWIFCIQFWCYPNLGRATTRCVLHNGALSQVFQNNRELPRRTTNSEAYYISPLNGLASIKNYGAKGIVIYTNFELVCNQMIDIYQVWSQNLKPLHNEANNSG